MAKASVCFERKDFDAETFDAGSFVRKWQATVTLDALREDLRGFTKELKDRLYELINRDYADFVKISSKLSGVDEIVEVVAQPLRSIRDEVRTLNTAVAHMRGEMETAMAGVHRSRACGALLEHCVRAVEAATLCQQLLGLVDDDADDEEGAGAGAGAYAASATGPAEQRWEAGRGLLDDAGALLLVRLRPADGIAREAPLAPENGLRLFVRPGATSAASRGQWDAANPLRYRFMRRGFALERAAHLCCELHGTLALVEELMQGVRKAAGQEALDTEKALAPESDEHAPSPSREEVPLEAGALSLAAETLEALQPLCHRLERECLTQASSLFSASISPHFEPRLRPSLLDAEEAGEPLKDLAPPDEMLTLGFQAVLRAATRLGKKAGLEQLFHRVVLKRAIEELLTPGQLDASGGRGRCKGLPKILASLHAYVARAALPAVAACDTIFPMADGAGPDLFVDGVLAAVFAHLVGPLRAVFAPGMAEVLQANYCCVQQFLRALCASLGQLLHLQASRGGDAVAAEALAARYERRVCASAAYAALETKWQLPVYLQLRVAEVTRFFDAFVSHAEQNGVQHDRAGAVEAGKPADPVQRLLDEAMARDPGLLLSVRQRGDDSEPEKAVFTPLARALAVALVYLWRDDVLLPPLVPQITGLSLALVGRFRAWAEAALGAIQEGNKSALRGAEEAMMLKADLATLGTWGAATLTPHAGARAAAAAAAGLGLMRAPSSPEDDVQSLVEAALREAVASLEGASAGVFDVAVAAVGQRCSDALVGVRGISAAYRFTNKPAPSMPSSYVGNILRPLTSFERDWAAFGDAEALAAFRRSVASALLTRLEEEVATLMQSVKQMEDALQRRRQTSASKGGRLSDGDKIILQMRLDVQSLEEALGKVGVSLAGDATWLRIGDLLPARDAP